MTITEKIIKSHLKEGVPERGKEVGIGIDQVLLQDTTGALALLEFGAIGLEKIRVKEAICYIDHNVLRVDCRNSNDHQFLKTACEKYGIHLSLAGNGICHQVHLERFAKPGTTLLGSDSHTPTAGGIGSLGIGAGGLDVAFALAGEPFFFVFPHIWKVILTKKLQPFVSAKDIILEILRRIGVEGGKGKIFEFWGDGVDTLEVPERSTITNMMVETGATSSIFPSDKNTLAFLKLQKRERGFRPISPDKNSQYDGEMEINLERLRPLIALPSSPGNVRTVREVEGMRVDQVCIGSCTNSSLKDLITVALLLKNKRVHKDCELIISPGSRQVVLNLEAMGYLKYLITAGAKLLEPACGPCIGMGQVPYSGAISLRTYNRNFPGRSGAQDDKVFLASPETAVASAIYGKISDPQRVFKKEQLEKIKKIAKRQIIVDDSRILMESKKGKKVKLFFGPTIKPLPELPQVIKNGTIMGKVLLKLGDNISTDEILPAGPKVLPLRTDIVESSKYTFSNIDKDFYKKALENGGGMIVAGKNYGQGSSREHAALCPRYLGIKAILAQSFARIHLANLINFGIFPFVLKRESDTGKIRVGDVIKVMVKDMNETEFIAFNITKNYKIPLLLLLSKREKEILWVGGKFNWIKRKNEQN